MDKKVASTPISNIKKQQPTTIELFGETPIEIGRS
jgi:hypothetical protein